jgi:dUTP pyrophosphatase
LNVSFQRLSAAARAPERANEHDAGWDLRAAQAAMIPPGGRASVGTGIAVAIPEGHAGLVLPRSGLAARHGIALVNAPGLIDAGYRGEVKAILHNTDGREPVVVEPGMRIAQLVLVPLPSVQLVEVAELPQSERGAGGLGSSGR